MEPHLIAVLSLLKQNHTPVEDIKKLCLVLFKQLKSIEDSKQCITILIHQGFSVSDDAIYYEIALTYPERAALVLFQLQELGLNKTSHFFIYQLFFLPENNPPVRSYYLSMKLINSLKRYVEKTVLLQQVEFGYEAQSDELRHRITNLIESESQLTQGPLNKSLATYGLEELLRNITTAKSEDILIRYDVTHGYILQIGSASEIYINHLLNQANFNHIDLSYDLVQAIGGCIRKISPVFDEESLIHNGLEKKLPEAAQKALLCYFGEWRYKNMNRLFRALPLIENIMYNWVTPIDGNANLLVHFLCGVLVNWAAKEVQLILAHSEERYLLEKVIKGLDSDMQQFKADNDYFEKQLTLSVQKGILTEEQSTQLKPLFSRLNDLFPEYDLLDRGELLDESEELASTARRGANPIITPSVTSVSARKEGVELFHRNGAVRIKFENTNSYRLVLQGVGFEREVLFPHGLSLIYTPNSTGGFFAKEVNSPGIIPTGSYWGATALSHAYHHHLQKIYADEACKVTVNNKIINRPNHGLAHTHRVMTFIKVIIDYFAHHAKEVQFRLFCIYISETEQDWLMVAAAFLVTGRESEIAVTENLQRYNEFKQASQENFTKFLKTHPPKQEDAAMQQRMEHIVRHIGNPAYENDFKGNPAINTHDNELEQKHRNFLHRIITTAHNLDLPRCYSPNEVDQAMASCRQFSMDTLGQQADYQRMLTYAIDLIKVHGDALRTDIALDGTLIPAFQNYRAPFDRVSTCMRDVQAMTDSIPRPRLTEKYQFATCDNTELIQPILIMCGQTEADYNLNSTRGCKQAGLH